MVRVRRSAYGVALLEVSGVTSAATTPYAVMRTIALVAAVDNLPNISGSGARMVLFGCGVYRDVIGVNLVSEVIDEPDADKASGSAGSTKAQLLQAATALTARPMSSAGGTCRPTQNGRSARHG